jgi:class 3 adenylate cyclase/tetratricopeptide (TPR) repeat protein
MLKCPGCGEDNPPKFRLCGYCGTPLASAAALPAHEVRKTVTIVFCDLKGSTALGERLDAEALHEVKERYFQAMAAEIMRHGGKIEKYIGDAIMAVFGLPRAHEDDALRAVRAAAGMRVALVRVNLDLEARYGVTLANRTGVNTGEVVANDDPNANQKLATGDAVNVAARLEQAAPEGQILLGELTYRLVRDAVDVEPVEPLELKGKSQRLPAYRLVAAHGLDGNVRRLDTPLVGRDRELSLLESVYRETCERTATRLITVIGDAGAGKTRLLAEFMDRRGGQARILRGRCLPYGDGITYWPLRGIVGEAAGIREDDAPDAARAKLLGSAGDPAVADRLASAVGLSASAFPLHDVNWAARKFLERLAANTPVIAFVDDIHWAEPAFLDLLEHVLDTATSVPLLLLATARHDLLEERPTWAERAGATRLVLGPLNEAAATRVVENLLGTSGLPADVVARIVAAAEGNPLFIEQMLSMLLDADVLREVNGQWVRGSGADDVTVPPTIHALLEARLDKLNREERVAVEPAAVIGLEFAQAALESLAPEAIRPAMSTHLRALTRKQFIDPTATRDTETIYRFHHQLVRDTVYNGLLKRTRATLHVNFVKWADRINAERGRGVEFQEILGYHLEQAYRYLSELGPLDEAGAALGADAATRLGEAGRRALSRGDLHAAANLIKRAIELLPQNVLSRAELLPDLAGTLLGLGDLSGARAAVAEGVSVAERLSSVRIRAACEFVGIFVRFHGEEHGDWTDETLEMVQDFIPVLEREAAHNELASAWRLIVLVHGLAGRYQLSCAAADRSIAHARLAGNERLIAKICGMQANNLLLGPTPVRQAIKDCQEIIAGGLYDRLVEANIMCMLAQLHAMNGELQPARDLYRRARTTLRDLGNRVYGAATGLDVARIELHDGDLALAEQEIRSDFEFLSAIGETYFLSSMAALLARLVRDQGRDAEALALSEVAEQATAPDDLESQALWRSVRAPILARAGEVAEGERLARESVTFARRTEASGLQAEVLSELASVLLESGKLDEARAAIDESLKVYAAKGNLVMSGKVQAWLAELDAASRPD